MVWTSDRGMGLEPGLPADVAEEERLPVATVSSTIVFHSPQAGHLPIHLGLSFPQEVQNQAVFILFAIMFNIQKKILYLFVDNIFQAFQRFVLSEITQQPQYCHMQHKQLNRSKPCKSRSTRCKQTPQQPQLSCSSCCKHKKKQRRELLQMP